MTMVRFQEDSPLLKILAPAIRRSRLVENLLEGNGGLTHGA